jgi:hypothetical protein
MRSRSHITCWLPHGIAGAASNHGSSSQEELTQGQVPGWICTYFTDAFLQAMEVI